MEINTFVLWTENLGHREGQEGVRGSASGGSLRVQVLSVGLAVREVGGVVFSSVFTFLKASSEKVMKFS